jgi:hypothetical protein
VLNLQLECIHYKLEGAVALNSLLLNERQLGRKCELKAVAFSKHSTGLLRVDNLTMKLLDCLIVSLFPWHIQSSQETSPYGKELVARKVEAVWRASNRMNGK